jgi:hypothetical protein
MFWDKEKVTIIVMGGKGSANTKKIRGMVQHLMVVTPTEDVVYDMQLIDKDGDVIYDVRGYIGRLDDKEGLPIGKDDQEKVTIKFSNVSENVPIDVIFKIREMS